MTEEQERYQEGDEVVITDFEGVEHKAALRRTAGIGHPDDCDEPWPCSHAFWAATWPITHCMGRPVEKGETVWPIGENWDRVKPTKRKPENVEVKEREEERRIYTERDKEARQHLHRVIHKALDEHSYVDNYAIYTTPPAFDPDTGRMLDACALVVGSGVDIVQATLHGDEHEKDRVSVERLGIYSRRQLIFLRDALTRLIDEGALSDE